MSPTNYRDDILPQDTAEDDSSFETATSQPLSEAEIEDLLYGDGRSTSERLELLRRLRGDIADREGYDVGDDDAAAPQPSEAAEDRAFRQPHLIRNATRGLLVVAADDRDDPPVEIIDIDGIHHIIIIIA